ncbi:hypothetical protein TNIN_167141 [Trichonephila inaurata madagascariensis]|uniref:Uncharacterized protein n=1 Tax=Trichonephila inaurata madagascariensis TaxID=2747483 RepID=A0A8X6WUR7_9ARAC|nr:hypothetical protein TNIN_167141 [Trichonephila inaurata madagascariensis]
MSSEEEKNSLGRNGKIFVPEFRARRSRRTSARNKVPKDSCPGCRKSSLLQPQFIITAADHLSSVTRMTCLDFLLPFFGQVIFSFIRFCFVMVITD